MYINSTIDALNLKKNIIVFILIRKLTETTICSNLKTNEKVIKKSIREFLSLLLTGINPVAVSGKQYKILNYG